VRHGRRDTAFDLGELVGTFGVFAGGACLYAGFWLLLASMAAARRRPSTSLAAGDQPAVAGPGTLLVVVGGAILVMSVMTIPGPWRKPEATHFPIHVLNLDIPPAAIERDSRPPASPAALAPTAP
jgi:hypothetical protein